jgi:predicted nucleic acid-binding protein
MAPFVIDASVALPWCFADEATEATNALLTRLRTSDEAIVPAHWPLEVANAISRLTLLAGRWDFAGAANRGQGAKHGESI